MTHTLTEKDPFFYFLGVGYFSFPNLNSSCLYLVPKLCDPGGPSQALDK